MPLQSDPSAPDELIPRTLPDALARGAAAGPDRLALIEGGERITYRDLLARSEAVARALRARGVRPGDPVGLCLANGVDWAVFYFGAARAGAVAVPINTRLKPAEIEYQLRQADVRLLFLAGRVLEIDFLALIAGFCPALPAPALPALRHLVVLGGPPPAGGESLADFLAAGEGADLPPPPAPDDPALIQFTSGTTSHPKGVVLSHAAMATDAYYVGRRMGIRPDDVYLSARPFFHVSGSTLSLLLSCLHGATLVTMRRFLADEALRLLAAERCTLTSGNDTMYLMLLNHPDFGRHRYHLRGGWAAVSPSIMERIVGEFGARETITAYGLSEASPNIVASDHADPLAERIEGWMRPHPGLEVRIVDPASGAALGPGQEGEIWARGWCLMQGYYRQPEATAQVITAEGFLRTGDLGVARADGRIRFVGRLKDIIRVGGENVAPADIENVLHQHPKVRQAQVFALPDPRLVEVPGAYILPREGESLTPEELLDWARPRLAGFKLPRHVAVIESFEAVGMTASAKVQKRHLIAHALKRFGLEPPR